ncbi:MAG TPA: isochorismate synthase [bacterium]|nr:isochorismate synthase [bacterium]
MPAFLPVVSRDARESGLGLVTLRAPARALERFLAAPIAGEALVWDPPAPECGAAPWSLAGRGIAARVEANGPEALARVRERAETVLDGLVERRDPGVWDAPSPRFFGGAAFRSAEGADPVWDGFAGASFVLPRWLYGQRGDEAFLRVIVDARDLADEGRFAEEIEAVLAALEGHGGLADEAGAARVVDATAPAAWSAFVGDALSAIERGELEKVVAARRTRVLARGDFSLPGTISRLRAQGDAATRFAFQRGKGIFLGATPERLVALCGDEVSCDALGGSLPRGAGDPESLLRSAKDRREHESVVRGIRGSLARFVREIDAPAEPRIRSLAAVHHLHTPVRARLIRPAHVLDLVGALHPTPAVCGLPRARAAAFLAEHEGMTRGWYASPVGWFDLAGDGCFAVALRCAVLRGSEAWLFAGAGIVKGSDADAEYRETAAKARPMLAALGVA